VFSVRRERQRKRERDWFILHHSEVRKAIETSPTKHTASLKMDPLQISTDAFLHLFTIEIFWNIINVFTFNQFAHSEYLNLYLNWFPVSPNLSVFLTLKKTIILCAFIHLITVSVPLLPRATCQVSHMHFFLRQAITQEWDSVCWPVPQTDSTCHCNPSLSLSL